MDIRGYETIGRYAILSKTARMASGAWYDAYDQSIDRHVSIRTIKTDSETPESVARFIRGVQAAGRLTHRNIIAIFDCASEADFTYVVTELFEARTLESVLDDGDLPLDRIALIFDQMMQGLAYCHRNGVIHRDIAPHNILVGTNNEVKIANFGVARMERGETTHIGSMVGIIGMPTYLSPEQLHGEAVDFRTDIYSAGVVLYEMLTGHPPFRGTPAEIRQRVLHDNPSPPSVEADMPFAFDHIVERAMAKQSADRFASATQFAECVMVAARIEATVPLLPKVGGHQWMRSQPVIIGAAMATLLIMVIGGWKLLANPHIALVEPRLTPAPEPAPPPTVQQRVLPPPASKPPALSSPPPLKQAAIIMVPPEPATKPQPALPSFDVTIDKVLSDLRRHADGGEEPAPRPQPVASLPVQPAPAPVVQQCNDTSPIGILFRCDDNQFTVIGVTAGSPADKAGLRAGDQIVAIDGKPITDLAILNLFIHNVVANVETRRSDGRIMVYITQ